MEIKRNLLPIIKNSLKKGKVIILYGARRTGKTFLLKRITTEYANKFLWLNGEDLDTQNVLAERTRANYVRLTSGFTLLVIDEAQAIPNIGLILKLMVDEIPSLKIIVSGSSAFELHHQIGEPLVGRAIWYELFPISQGELKDHESLLQSVQNLPERLIYGSYPEIFQLNTMGDKEKYLKDMVESYLFRDVLNFDGVRNSSKIKDLLRLIAFQIGKEVSLDELGRQLGMSKNTVEKYLDILEKAFVLKKIRAFSRNLRKEISKSSRWYFWDIGIRNALIADFKPLELRRDIGEIWENYLMMERLKKIAYNNENVESYFWRTYDQQEIDLVETNGDNIEAFEFKWNDAKVKIPEAFSKAYPGAAFEKITKQNYLGFIE